MTQNNHLRARSALHAWENNKPTNFFRADVNLQHVLQMYLGDRYAEAAERLDAFGEACATTIDRSAKIEDEIGNHPRLNRYTGIGERVEEIEFHPNHDITGALIWQSGMLSLQSEPGNTVTQMALFYLLSHDGEAGHCCSIACTSGLIRALQTAASPEVRDQFLPPLIDPNFAQMQHGAQFLTEVQGGGDVGANSVRAVSAGDGSTWRISGEKWFCSNINADQFLVTARPVNDQGESLSGTAGLGAFVIPRVLQDGTTNGFYLRRMKDKLGTRTLASAEVDFVDAVAYPIGRLDQGFKIVVELVLNTSRLMNAVSCAGITRRAYLEAASYACAREAFGQPIAAYPMVQEAVADIMAEAYAGVASGFYLAHLLDRIETGTASDAEKAIYRLLVNANKYITSVRANEAVHRAIEVFGGNGAIETFSILPRLYRDVIVLESWEGTHNVLALQIWRDIGKYRVHEPYLQWIQQELSVIRADALLPLVAIVRGAAERTAALIARLAASETTVQQAHVRRLTDLLADVGQAALLLREAQWETDRGLNTIKPDAAAHFIRRRLQPDYDPLEDQELLPRLARIMAL